LASAIKAPPGADAEKFYPDCHILQFIQNAGNIIIRREGAGETAPPKEAAAA
jgi:hypothetical protein